MKREITKIAMSLCIVAVGLFCVDCLVKYAGSKALQSIPDHGGDTNKMNYILNRMDVDVAVLGSSRASHHYDMEVLMDSINQYSNDYKSCFNAGIDGKFTNCSFCVFESMLWRCHPKMVIIDLNTTDFFLTENYEYSKIKSFSPHYTLNTVVKDYIDRMASKEKFFVKSGLYRYNSMPLRLIKSSLSKTKEWDGYEPINGVLPDDENDVVENYGDNVVENKYEVSDYTIENFERVIRLSKENGVKLIFAVSPNYRKSEIGLELITELCKEYDVPFVNMCSTPQFDSQRKLFKDIVHLNAAGATLYTSMFFQQIIPYL